MASHFAQTTRALRSDNARPAHIAWAIACVGLAVWGLWFAIASVNVYEVSQKARLEVRKASYQLDAQVAGQVRTSALALGREVSAGEVVVELDDSRDRLRLAEEQARLDALTSRISSLTREIAARQQAKDGDLETATALVEVTQAKIAETQASLDFSKGSEDRFGRLLASGIGARVDSLKAATESQKLAAAIAGLRAETARIERDARSKDHQNEAQIEALRHALTQIDGDIAVSRATIARLTTELDKYQLRAPIAGRLGDIAPYRPGAYVAEGQRLATIVPADDLIVVAEFMPSFAFGRVRTGQKARLRLDGFPWAQYGTVPATVRGVAGEVRDNLIRVELSVDAIPPGLSLQHGLPGIVEVSIEEATPATLVLRSAGLLLAGNTRGTTP